MSIFVIAAVLVGFWGVMTVNAYRRLTILQGRYQNMYVQLGVQLQHRYDLTGNLVARLKGNIPAEQAVLEAVMGAMQNAESANRQAMADPGNGQAMQQLAMSEAELSVSLVQLFSVIAATPHLSADPILRQLMQDLRASAQQITFVQQAFNDGVKLFNQRAAGFPSNLVAVIFKFGSVNPIEIWMPEGQQPASTVR